MLASGAVHRSIAAWPLASRSPLRSPPRPDRPPRRRSGPTSGWRAAPGSTPTRTAPPARWTAPRRRRSSAGCASPGPARGAGSSSRSPRPAASTPGPSGADAIGSRLDLAGRLALAPALALLGSAAGSDYRERDGQLDRAAARGALTLALDGEGLGATLTAGWSLFAPRLAALRPFRADGPEAWLGGRWSPAPGHQLTAALGGSRSFYRAWPGQAAGTTALRVDEAWGLEAGWSWQGPALLGAAWGYTDSRSDVAGGDFRRHRLSASLAVELPAALTLAGRAALQWTRYPDPLLVAAQQALAEGQENLDRLELRLSRPLAERLEVALTGAWTHADGGAGVAGYQRLTVGLVLAWRTVLPWP